MKDHLWATKKEALLRHALAFNNAHKKIKLCWMHPFVPSAASLLKKLGQMLHSRLKMCWDHGYEDADARVLSVENKWFLTQLQDNKRAKRARYLWCQAKPNQNQVLSRIDEWIKSKDPQDCLNHLHQGAKMS